MYTLYYGNIVHTPKLGSIEILLNHYVGINAQGTIEFVKKASSKEEALELVKSGGNVKDEEVAFVDNSHKLASFLMPGFIDTHIHASQYPNIGIGSDLPLLDWLNNHTFALELKLNGSEEGKRLARDVYNKVLDRTLSNGTTCASYFTTVNTETTEIFADLAAEKGQRAFVGKVCMDCNDSFPSYQETLEETVANMKRLVDHCHKLESKGVDCSLVCPIVTPRFAPVCLSELLTELGQMVKQYDLPVQTHVSENKDEISWVQSLFPECPNYTSVYNKFGLLNERTILAHGIHLTGPELELIKSKKTSLAHCPSSNTFITSGEAPVKKYLHEDGINISLGTDLAGGYEQSILGVARALVMVSHHLAMDAEKDCKIGVAEALYMATVGGAKACNLGNAVGTLEAGKKFDAQLIDLDVPGTNVDVFDFQRPDGNDKPEAVQDKILNLLYKWVFAGDDRNCVRVWCNGRVVVDKTRVA